jgi:CO/xanthine dehydrogenase FAD-binding subunit
VERELARAALVKAVRAARRSWSREWPAATLLAVAARPARARTAEALLAERTADDEAIREAAAGARDVVEAADDVAASQALRRRLVETLTERALRMAVARAKDAASRK